MSIDFQPMPKRFMVWDRVSKSFCGSRHNDNGIFDSVELSVFFMRQANTGRPHTDFEVIQSTNLFDKDGKEIFEGSVLSIFEYKGLTGECVEIDAGVVMMKDGSVMVGGTSYSDLIYSGKELIIENIGHILSNPELLEER